MRGVIYMGLSKRIRCKVLLIIMAFINILDHGSVALANELPYDTYNYNFYEDIVYTPAAYIPSGSISGTQLIYEGESLGVLSNPQDICKTPSGDVVLADTGNHRIIILNKDMTKVIKVIKDFDYNGEVGTFSSPYGVCVSKKNELYIADTFNNRIVVLDEDNNLVKIIKNPTSEVLEDSYVFSPLKVSVDYADRIYCIAQNMFEGIMVFENNGQFIGFIGTIEVEISLWEKFWKRIATKEERSNQRLFIPTEFTGIDIDDDGFVYASNIDEAGEQAIRRLNPRGQDVIKKGKNENLGGDLWSAGFGKYSGASQITDLVYRQKGMYSLLDRKRGRIFTYDHEGNLLYIFGGLGTQAGTFVTPVAIENIGNTIIVLDAYRAEILTFSETQYGSLINNAVGLRHDGDETKAVELWKKVLNLDENNELAYVGIGKAYLTSGDYVNAMDYLKKGMSSEFYSIAFRRYRNEVLKENMSFLLTGAVILVIIIVVAKGIYRKKKGLEKEEGLLNE
ncbi:MAG: gluconolactonase [Anaerolineaceae bacterium]|nr:MAG: gluconolactonase [Anaerolineaceae bacterium]